MRKTPIKEIPQINQIIKEKHNLIRGKFSWYPNNLSLENEEREK